MNLSFESFAVACPHCGVGLKVAASDLGQQRDCPKCHAQFKLPSRQRAEAAAEAKRLATEEFGFLCQLCGSRLYARPQQVGNPIKCPDCHTVNHVPAPQKTVPRKIIDAGEEYELAVADDDQASPGQGEAVEQFAFRCRVCETVISAARSAVGKHTACPDCSTVMVVPTPPPAKKKVVVEATDPGIAVVAAAPRPPRQETNVDQLMGDARDKVAERERQKPKPPKHPFLSGVFLFPFQLLSLPYLIVFTFLGCLPPVLIEMTLELQGVEIILGIFLTMIASMVVLILVGLSSNYLMRVLHWTAMGYPNVLESPQFEIFEFLRQALFVINAFGAGACPGLLVGMACHDALLGFALTMLSAFIFFPFILLSFVDAESPTTPYSSFIMSTFRTSPGSWLKFYALASVVVSIAVMSHLLSVMHSQSALPPALADFVSQPALEVFSVATTVGAAMIYFRLLGRLAYVIDQKTFQQAKQQKSPA